MRVIGKLICFTVNANYPTDVQAQSQSTPIDDNLGIEDLCSVLC